MGAQSLLGIRHNDSCERFVWPRRARKEESSMSAINPTLSDMQSAVKETVRLHWQLFLAQGVIMLILGILAVIWPGISTIAVDVYVGWLFLFSGIVGLFTMFLA